MHKSNYDHGSWKEDVSQRFEENHRDSDLT